MEAEDWAKGSVFQRSQPYESQGILIKAKEMRPFKGLMISLDPLFGSR